MAVAQVVFNRPLFQEFTYSIPEGLEDLARPGRRAMVYFSGSRQVGIISAITEKIEGSPPRLLPLLGVIDGFDLLDAIRLELGREVARRYFCPLGVVLFSFIPGGVKTRADPLFVPQDPPPSTALEGAEEAAIVEFLRTHGEASFSTLQTHFLGHIPAKILRPLLESLQERKWIKIRGNHPRLQKPKSETTRFYRLNPRPPVPINRIKSPLRVKLLGEMVKDPEREWSEIALEKTVGGRLGPHLKELTRREFLTERKVVQVFQPQGEEYYLETEPAYRSKMVLTPDQKRVFEAISTGQKRGYLLHGVTCSGKTEVYLQLTEQAIAQGKSVLVLVPEIALTPQLGRRFISRFGPIVGFQHSALTPGERAAQWQLIQEGVVKIVIGARSALFSPVHNLGLIIMDEEGENSYKQETNPRYHAREVLAILSRITHCPFVLGSATPTMESYYLARQGGLELLELPHSIFGDKPKRIELVDMREELKTRFNKSLFSTLLQTRMGECLKLSKKIMLFLNKRGYSSAILCRECGHKIECINCHVSLCEHRETHQARCHFCDYKIPTPRQCPECKSFKIRGFGTGTERVEAEARTLFPEATILRLDSDTVKSRHDYQTIFRDMEQGKIDILIGTQIIAKGLDFQNVGLVGVIAADLLLNLPDFRANERTFTLLNQVVGRTGRGDFESAVVVQSYRPDHYSVTLGLKQDYPAFFARELGYRRDLFYPPYSHLVRIMFFGRSEEDAKKFAMTGGDIIKIFQEDNSLTENLQICGPAPAPIDFIRKEYRFGLLLKSDRFQNFEGLLAHLSKNLKSSTGLHYTIDVDPYDFI